MKKTILTEDAARASQSFFDEEIFAANNQIATRDGAALQGGAAAGGGVSDRILAAVKWLFLYLPGAALVHFIMFGFALLSFYNDWSTPILAASGGLLVFAMFMIMFGIGKMADLKYLRVVGAVALTSLLAAALYRLSIVFVPGDFFALFAQLTLPATVFAGLLAKRRLDRRESET